MTARGAGSPAQKTKARAPAKQDAKVSAPRVRPAADGDEVTGVPEILRFDTSANGHDTTRIPLFSIDGKVYTIPAHPTMSLGLEVQDISTDDSVPFGIAVSRANKHMMIALLGEEGYRDLITCKTITREAFTKIVGICTGIVLGQVEDDPKGASRRG